jgi:excisionase family DNA binding protein
MKHPTDEIIIAYLYKEAAAEDIKAVEKHIAECRSCAEKIEGIKNTIFDIDQMDDAAVPEFLENKLADFFEKIAMIDMPGAKIEKNDDAEKMNEAANASESGQVKAANGLKETAKNAYDNIKSGKESKREPGQIDHNGGVRSCGDILTPEELAEYLKIPANSIYDMLNEIPHLILAGRVRFRKNSIDKWLDSREKNAPTKISAIRDFDDSVKLWRNVI